MSENQKTVIILDEFGRESTVQIPAKGMLIQTIYKHEIGNSILPNEREVGGVISNLHEMEGDAYVIVCAPIEQSKLSNSASHHFENTQNDEYRRYVTTIDNLSKAGLSDFAQIRKDANMLRQKNGNIPAPVLEMLAV